MLVITRKKSEQLHIGSNITVTVIKIQGNRVTLGIDAPEDVPVVRGELPRMEHGAPTPKDGLTDVYADADESVKEQTI